MRDSQDQGATISTTNTNVGDTDELNEWSNEHMGGHMTKRMPNGEQNEELLMDKTECQNQDTTPTLIPLEANLPMTTRIQHRSQNMREETSPQVHQGMPSRTQLQTQQATGKETSHLTGT